MYLFFNSPYYSSKQVEIIFFFLILFTQITHFTLFLSFLFLSCTSLLIQAVRYISWILITSNNETMLWTTEQITPNKQSIVYMEIMTDQVEILTIEQKGKTRSTINVRVTIKCWKNPRISYRMDWLLFLIKHL